MDAMTLKLMAELCNPVKARMYLSANQTNWGQNAFVAIPFDTKEYDYVGMIGGLGTASASFTVPFSGWYLVSMGCQFATTAANGVVACSIGNTSSLANIATGSDWDTTVAGPSNEQLTCSGVFVFAPGTTVAAAAFQSIAATGETLSGGSNITWMSIHLLCEGFS